MKFLNFLANTLPRTRKSKGDQKKLAPVSPPPSIPPPTTPLITLPDKPVVNKPESLAFNKYLVTEDFHYLPRNKPVVDENRALNLENNINRDFDSKREYVKRIHTSPCASPTYFDDDPLSFGSIQPQAKYYTVPRTRTLIRTNPWLPSPMSSPLPSPMTSSTASPTSSEVTNRRGWDPNNPDAEIPMSVDGSSSCDNRSYLSTEVDSMLDSATLCNQDMTSLEADVTSDALNDNIHSDYDTETLCDRKRDSVIEQLTFFSPDSALSSYEDIHASDFEVSFEDGETVITPKKSPDETENFDYEDEFEAIVESVRSESNRLFGADSRSDIFSSRSSFGSRFGGDKRSSFYDTRRSSLDDKFSSLDGTRSPFDDNRSAYDNHSLYRTDSRCSSDMVTSLDSAYESTLSPSRSLVEIQSSLKDTMDKLEEGKTILDEFIREEKEDKLKSSPVKLPELIKFQKQVTLFRKKLLLETLQDLKNRLDDQGKRLQTAYSSVLNKQWERALNKQRLMCKNCDSGCTIGSDGLRETIL